MGVYLLEFAGTDDRFATREVESAAASGVDPVAVGLATARGIDPDRIRDLAYTRWASELVGRTDASIESAVSLLELAGIDRQGTVAVRARDVRSATGIDTQQVERELGQVLVDRGFAVDLDDPDHELRAVFAAPLESESETRGITRLGDDDAPPGRDPGDPVCAIGWRVGASIRDFGDRSPTDRPFFQPGSMDPLLARALVNVAGAGPETTVLDPMCGTGGVLVEAGLVGARPVGVDAQAKMARGARRNLHEYVPDSDFATMLGDAARLPLADDAVDGVVFDAPYGRQSKIAADRLEDLVGDALAEARRVASRAVVVGDRSWAGQARTAGWSVVETFERRVHRSLVRYVLVLEDRERIPDADALVGDER